MGERWRRWRMSSWTWRWREGRRIEFDAELNGYAWPLPRFSWYFEGRELAFGFALREMLNDAPVSFGVTITLPGWAADLLDRVLPRR